MIIGLSLFFCKTRRWTAFYVDYRGTTSAYRKDVDCIVSLAERDGYALFILSETEIVLFRKRERASELLLIGRKDRDV